MCPLHSLLGRDVGGALLSEGRELLCPALQVCSVIELPARSRRVVGCAAV